VILILVALVLGLVLGKIKIHAFFLY